MQVQRFGHRRLCSTATTPLRCQPAVPVRGVPLRVWAKKPTSCTTITCHLLALPAITIPTDPMGIPIWPFIEARMEPPWEPDCSPHRDSHGGHPNGPRGVPLKMPSGKAPLRWPLSPVSFTPITNLPEPARATEDAVWEALTHRSCHLLVLPPIATPTDPTIFFFDSFRV